MTEQAGYMNGTDLIDECTDAAIEAELEYANSRAVAYAVIAVLRKRGLITGQGLELIKQSGESK